MSEGNAVNSPKPQNADTVMSADAAALVQAKRDRGVSESVRAPSSARAPAPAAGDRQRDVTKGVPGGKAPAAQGGVPGGLEAALPPVPAEAATARASDHLVGLAFSGGGIRSATFSLGVLQRMAMLDHLERIDLLSSVSGGG